MNTELKQCLRLALQGQGLITKDANFTVEDTNTSAVNGIIKELGIKDPTSSREIRAHEDAAFALIEESVDEILPAKLQEVLGQFAEVRNFPRDAEMVFNIEKVGKNRAKLTISKGARGGIYRAARLDNKFFSLSDSVMTVAVYATLEEIIVGSISLAELFTNILEGFQEAIYKDVFTALAVGTPVTGYSRINGGADANVTTTKTGLDASLDKVLPYVRQYGVPTIFGSTAALSAIQNEGANYHLETQDMADKRNFGYVRLYKGIQVVELPNYIADIGSTDWVYDPTYVFVIPSSVKPVKVGLKGDLIIQKDTQATGSVKWEANKIVGVGVAMANSFAVIKVTDAA
jgi:hypothetical protein